MTLLLEQGFVDTFRTLYPEKTGAYTFWTYFSNARARNVGWLVMYNVLLTKYTIYILMYLIDYNSN